MEGAWEAQSSSSGTKCHTVRPSAVAPGSLLAWMPSFRGIIGITSQSLH